DLRRLAVAFGALALTHRALVPPETEPFEVVEDRLGAARHVPGGIGVVDAEEERPAVLVGEDAICHRAERPSQVERAGGARRKTHTDHARTLPRLSCRADYGRLEGPSLRLALRRCGSRRADRGGQRSRETEGRRYTARCAAQVR